MTDVQDLRSTIIPKSDQLNTDQLLGGPLIITVTDVRAGGGEDQPVSIYYEADEARPYKPCKTMRKVLIHAWGPNGHNWVGKSMELYAEPSVKFGGELVGGIRISRLTDIPAQINVSLTATKGRKTMHEIAPLKLSSALAEVLAEINAATDGEGLRRARVKARSALTNKADLDSAFSAYTKRVEALQEQAAKSSPTIDPSDRPDTGTDERFADKPQRDEPREHPADHKPPSPTYAQLAARVNRCTTREAAELALDEGRGLPSDQQADLLRVFDDRFPL